MIIAATVKKYNIDVFTVFPQLFLTTYPMCDTWLFPLLSHIHMLYVRHILSCLGGLCFLQLDLDRCFACLSFYIFLICQPPPRCVAVLFCVDLVFGQKKKALTLSKRVVVFCIELSPCFGWWDTFCIPLWSYHFVDQRFGGGIVLDTPLWGWCTVRLRVSVFNIDQHIQVLIVRFSTDITGTYMIVMNQNTFLC